TRNTAKIPAASSPMSRNPSVAAAPLPAPRRAPQVLPLLASPYSTFLRASRGLGSAVGSLPGSDPQPHRPRIPARNRSRSSGLICAHRASQCSRQPRFQPRSPHAQIQHPLANEAAQARLLALDCLGNQLVLLVDRQIPASHPASAFTVVILTRKGSESPYFACLSKCVNGSNREIL